MPLILRLGASIALSLALTSCAFAGINRWTSNGPPTAGVRNLAIDPVQPATIYAAAGDAGLFRSTDGGGTWSLITIEPRINPAVTAVAVDPVTPRTVYAGSINSVGGGLAPRALLYKSTDGGETWYAADLGLPEGEVFLLAIAPSLPTTICLRDGARLFKTSDGARTWTALSLQVENILSVAFDPLNAQTVFAAAYGGRTPTGGVFRSTDGGDSWTGTQAPLIRPKTVVIDPLNTANIYATDDFKFGFAKSTDGGETWTFANAPFVLQSLLFDRQNPPVLYAATYFVGVFRSKDDGNTWDSLNTGLSDFTVSSLAVDALGTRLYAGTYDAGVFDYEILISRQRVEPGRHHPPARQVEPRS